MYSPHRNIVIAIPIHSLQSSPRHSNDPTTSNYHASRDSQHINANLSSNLTKQRQHYTWKDHKQDRVLLKIMLRQTEKGNSFPFKSTVWNTIERRYNREFEDMPAEKRQLQSRWQSLRKMMKVYSSAKQDSSLQWDRIQNRPCCTKEVWDEWCKDSPNNCIKPYFDKPFPYEDIIQRIAPMQTAIGESASCFTNSTQTQNESCDDELYSSDCPHTVSQTVGYQKRGYPTDANSLPPCCLNPTSQTSMFNRPASSLPLDSRSGSDDLYRLMRSPLTASSTLMEQFPNDFQISGPEGRHVSPSTHNILNIAFPSSHRLSPITVESNGVDRLTLAIENLGENFFGAAFRAYQAFQEYSNYVKKAVKEFMELKDELGISPKELIPIVEMLRDKPTANMFLAMNSEFKKHWVYYKWEQLNRRTNK
ncbi:hypothetical protein BKA69DRAFT_317517 [Paraphysoderma sedebokerense]|nr:hypothetical protein BKA69DRAFT_317517 [Paraphysoderma sedebokerense]